VYNQHDNFIYVADTGNHRIQVFDTKGNIKHEIGGLGKTIQFNNPNRIAVDDNGFIYIADTGDKRIIILDSDYSVTLEIEKNLINPIDVDVDKYGFIYVLDAGGWRQNYLLKFDQNGKLLFKAGTAQLGIEIDKPSGLAINNNNIIYVATQKGVHILTP